ncbi:SufE family protein [Microbacterium amylolyticum]|uniref:Cysteine desulfuration protein SufE n=1 Tax=Microbacterium amylolyticum TaxID=936337 RepID=A0ABS4ZE62_9MICO|nr:SufE family protein [Microbacterium amylolyticum]MBP2435497.1 cysteine desulfuration protein SufE [Microbacterium amylolyticum]
MTDTLPPALAEIRDDILSVEGADRLHMLVEIGDELPPAPEPYASDPSQAERVTECQSPVFIAIEVVDDIVTMHAIAPAEAPTTRGFATILAQGISGAPRAQVLAIPDDFPTTLGLGALVSPLRISGMVGMLRRAKRQVAAQAQVTG